MHLSWGQGQQIGGLTETGVRVPARPTWRWDSRKRKRKKNRSMCPIALGTQMGGTDFASNWSLQGSPDPARPTGWSVTAETVSELCQQKQVKEAVEALGVLVRVQCRVSRSLFHVVLKECVSRKDLVLGRRVHGLSVKKGYESDTFLCNHILRMYASHAMLQEAMDVFTMVWKPDAFAWSCIIAAHVKRGQAQQAIQLYHQMRRTSVKPDGHVFVAALQACARVVDLSTGQQVHADVESSGVEPDLFVCSCLVDMYAKCGSLENARRVFDGLSKKDVVTWTALIAGYSQQGMGQQALDLYSAMREEGITPPDSVTFLCLLQACASVGTTALGTGKLLNSQIGELGLRDDVTIGNNLINMYSKCGSLEDAQRVFDGLRQKDVVTWNAIIGGYSQQLRGQDALQLYSSMQEEAIVTPDSVTFVCVLQACASVGTVALQKGKQIHGQIEERGLQADVVVGCSLVNMYAKCGSLEDAESVFDKLSQKTVVTWNAMLAGYSQQGKGQEALRLYSSMQQEGISSPDSVTFVSLLQACASVAALHLGRQLHAEIEREGIQADVLVATSLINMYAKSGSMGDAQQVFDELSERDRFSWNALIAGYSRQGDSQMVFNLVQQMRGDGLQPDSVTFLSVLTVCSHVGLVNKGREYFENMSSQFGIKPTPEHCSCMVDLLGRAGHLVEALAVVRTMPVQPHAAVWRTLLGACHKWSNVEVGRHAFNEVVKLDEADAAAYVLMSNIYTNAQIWEGVLEMQAKRKGIAWKQPGQSWWTDMDGVVHSFSVGDKRHPGMEAIYAMLRQLAPRMKTKGYPS